MKNLRLLFALLFLASFTIACENEDTTAELYEFEIQDQVDATGDDDDTVHDPQKD